MNVFRNSQNSKLRWTLLALFVVAEFTFFILFRKVNLDEGWYLWAGKLVYEGSQLYRDFAYTQTPLLPYIYGLFQSLFGQGIYQGRILSALLGISSGLLCAWIVRRHLRTVLPQKTDLADGTSFFCLALFATSFYTICYFVYTATYPLASFFLVCAVGSLFINRKTARIILATVFMSLAIATRMSAVGALPAMVLYLLVTSRPQDQVGWSRASFTRASFTRASFTQAVGIIAVTGIVSAVVLLGPFWLLSGELMVYDIFGFHTDRIPSITRQWYRQLTTLRRSGWIYAAPLLVMLCSLGAGFWMRKSLPRVSSLQVGWRSWLGRNSFVLLLAGMILGPLLLHLVPRTTDAYYNTLQFPLLCILVSVSAARAIGLLGGGPRESMDSGEQKTLPTNATWFGPKSLLLFSLLLNAIIHVVAVAQFDLVSVNKKTWLPVNQVAVVQEAADFLSGIDKQTNELLTLNTHLALETEMVVPQGYEMSIFAYRPDWSDADAARYHVINNEMLIEDLAAGADAVAITDFDAERFYGKRQQIFDTLTQNYRHAKTVANFDPRHNNLSIYLPPQFSGPRLQYMVSARADNGIELLGYDLPKDGYAAGEVLDIALYWQADSAVAQPYTTFVQVLNSAGALVVGKDNPPCQQTCPTQSWLPGEVLRDEYRVELPADLELGEYMVQVGLYHSETVETLVLNISPGTSLQRVDVNGINEVVDGRLRLTRIEVR